MRDWIRCSLKDCLSSVKIKRNGNKSRDFNAEFQKCEQMMRLYGLKNCDTCRKALKALPAADLVDVRAEGVPDAVLAAALDRFGDALVNTRSTTWRGLDAHQREAPALDLLKAHPSLMKRPLIETETDLYLGWDKDTQDVLGTS